MRLPSVRDLQVSKKTVLLRTNYDVPLLAKDKRAGAGDNYRVSNGTRIEESVETIELLLKKGAERIILLSHLGKPGGKAVPEQSLKPVAAYLSPRLKTKNFRQKSGRAGRQGKVKNFSGFEIDEKVFLVENVRFWPGEEENDRDFAGKLASLADVYVNDAFACSHRKHASIVGIPKFLPSVFGLDMVEEIRALSKVRGKPRRPVVLLLGGAKPNKLDAARKLVKWADWILVGGLLVEYDGLPELLDHPKVEGNLIKSGQDITIETARKFAEIIDQAGTVVWAGPMGNFYDRRYFKGTEVVAKAVVKSKAYSVVGGGDTETALTQLGLVDKIDYLSSGGGAMLEFLARGTLPGVEAVMKKRKD